jgi:hypothetical protein
MRHHALQVASFFALASVLGCGGGGSDSTETSRMSIKLTDAPGANIQSAVVTIDEIYLQGNERVSLRSDPVTTDLLTLTNDVQTLVDDVAVPAGTYSQLRFVISGAYIEVAEEGSTRIFATDGYDHLPPDRTADGTLQTPSWDSSGFKVKLPDGSLEVAGEQKILLVDFDVAESFGQEAGASGRWVVRPTLKATDFELSSSIRVNLHADPGVSSASLADLNVELKDKDGNSEGLLAPTDPEGDGIYSVTFLYLDADQGPFELDITAAGSITTDPTLPLQVSVTAANETTIDVTVTAISP